MPYRSDVSRHLLLADLWVTMCAARAANEHAAGYDDLISLLSNAPHMDHAQFGSEVETWRAQFGGRMVELSVKLPTPAVLPAMWLSVTTSSDKLGRCHEEFWWAATKLLEGTGHPDRARRAACAGLADSLFVHYNHALTIGLSTSLLAVLADEAFHVPAFAVEWLEVTGTRGRELFTSFVVTDPVAAVEALADLWMHAAKHPWTWSIIDPDKATGWPRPKFPVRLAVAEKLESFVPNLCDTVRRTSVLAFSSWNDDESAVLWLTSLGLLPTHPQAGDMFISFRGSNLDVGQVCATVTASLVGLLPAAAR